MKSAILFCLFFGVVLLCAPLLSYGQSTGSEYPEGWRIKFLDSDIETLEDAHVTTYKMMRDISAAGNIYKGGKFNCSIANYGSPGFRAFSLETADGITYKMFVDPNTQKPSMQPEVIKDEEGLLFVKFSGWVKSDEKTVEIKGYFKDK